MTHLKVTNIQEEASAETTRTHARTHTRTHTHARTHTHTQKISKESQISESSNTKYNAIMFKEIKLTTDKINMKQKTHKNKQVF